MSLDSQIGADLRIGFVRQRMAQILNGDLASYSPLPSMPDDLDDIASGLNQIAERLDHYASSSAQIEKHSQGILDVMFAAAAQDYTMRAPVTDQDTVLDALATGLNMLLEELAANQEAAISLREEIIRSQEAAIRELSTPLIPITESVLILPLIGSVDSRRAHHIFERILHGVAEFRAHTVIVDITGVAVVDTQVASVLLNAARAVQLLGAQVILTGIRPEVAQTLVGLGVNMRDIVTRGTLQAGIEYATQTARFGG